MQLFNAWYFQHLSGKQNEYFVPLHTYFYPLDGINNWNRLYGKRGFIQYQCVLSETQALTGIMQIMQLLHQSGYPGFHATLKYFGDENNAMLSFPMKGFSLAVDIPLQDVGLLKILDKLDEIVIKHQGRVYLAKDARLRADVFRAMYPRYEAWRKIKSTVDPKNFFNSDLARRLRLGEE